MVEQNNSETGPSPRLSGRVVSTATFFVALAVAAVAVVLFSRMFAPEPHLKLLTPAGGYSIDAMREAVSSENVRAEAGRLSAFGSRYMGQPGYYDVEDYIRKTYEEAGLEVSEQTNWTPAPRTLYSEFIPLDLSAIENPESGIPKVYPFLPNHMQPMVTPTEGIEGRLVVASKELLESETRFDNAIAVIDARDDMIPKGWGFSWLRYARVGFKALIVAHPGGLEEMPWHRMHGTTGMAASVPVNYVRLAATREIFDYIGQRVRVRVKTEFANVKNTTILGLLRSGDTTPDNPAKDVLLIEANYDASSYLPDLAPGGMQAVNPALQLCILKGLLPYKKTLERDVLFVSGGARTMAADDENNLLRVLNTNIAKAKDNRFVATFRFGEEEEDAKQMDEGTSLRILPWIERDKTNEETFEKVRAGRALIDTPDFMADTQATVDAIRALDRKTRLFFEKQYQYTMNSLILEHSEKRLEAKVAFEREEHLGLDTDVFREYLAIRKSYERIVTATGYSIKNLLNKKEEFVKKHEVLRRLRERFDGLIAHHERRRMQLAQDMAISRLFDSYQNTLVVRLWLAPVFDEDQREEILSFETGLAVLEAQVDTFKSVLSYAKNQLALDEEIEIAPLSRWHWYKCTGEIRQKPPTYMWSEAGFPTYTMVNFSRGESYSRGPYPVDLPFVEDCQGLEHSMAVTGVGILSLAHGSGTYPPTLMTGWQRGSFGGRVLLSGVGQSIMPNYPLKNALVGSGPNRNAYSFGKAGYYEFPFIFTDPYGRYDLPNNASDFPNYHLTWLFGGYSPLAAGYGEDGLIAYMKDEGKEGQRLFKSVKVNRWNLSKLKNTIIVTFRATPVSILDLTNPQTMKDYTRVTFIEREGLREFRKTATVQDTGVTTTFVEPDEHFYVKLEAGTLDNEYAQVTRGFMLGTPNLDGNSDGVPIEYGMNPDKMLEGPGFLAADTPLLLDVPRKVARSMANVNKKRLEMQNKYGMADDRTNAYSEKGVGLSATSEDGTLSQHESSKNARESVTYSTLNHPVIRESIFEAVIGILWYLALLVPFVFFFEKLVFGFTDIRKQLAAQVVIFAVVFTLLRILHPAFEMLRSSLMILLSFVIILISGSTIFLFFGKFKENLEELKQRRGRVSAAEVNAMTAMGSALLLGLNNMHRRKVRTGMTCITLTLLTFVMICFTSAQNELVDEAKPLGKAHYQGILMKRERFRMFTPPEVFIVKNKYGDDFDVCERKMIFGRENWVEKQRYNPDLEMSYVKNGRERKLDFDSVLQFSYMEPLRNKIEFLTENEWFTEEEEIESDDIIPIMISDAMARNLGISIEEVNASSSSTGALPVEVVINGKNFLVRGIFDSESLNNLHDLDGLDLLPFNIETMRVVIMERTEGTEIVLADSTAPRIFAEDVILTPLRGLKIMIENGLGPVTESIAISMPDADVPYKEAKEAVVSYMEQTSKPTFYGLQGNAYVGKRTRETSLAGLLDLIVPLIIAALTVLNTMKGSVYERRDEIFVYNAVGIAPRYVFFMFFAEAVVYAVVGSVLGYILSQGSGRILTALDWTGGMNMTFTSLTTIYASLTIAAAVFISTYFPARSAMKIAAPAEESGWGLPEPEGDLLRFDLPFTFNKRDRVAVLAFFARYLSDHGEGSAGRFFTNEPRLGIDERPDVVGNTGYIPMITSTSWLKPFDLGVSQQMDILLPMDPETAEFKAQIVLTRLSGTREAWLRLNKSFVALIRRHFLHWRAVSDEERAEMFHEAKQLMDVQTVVEKWSGEWAVEK